jgi:hypothetical protein
MYLTLNLWISGKFIMEPSLGALPRTTQWREVPQHMGSEM